MMMTLLKYILIALASIAVAYYVYVKQVLNAANSCNSLLYPKADNDMPKTKEESEVFAARFSDCVRREIKFPSSVIFNAR